MKRMIGSVIIVAAIALSSCGLLGNNDVSVFFQGSSAAAAGSYAIKTTVAAGIELTALKLSIRDVEFKQDENDPDSPAEVYFTGPFELDLLDSTGPLEQTIGSADVPAGTYQEIRFKLHKTTDVDVTSELYDRSIFLAGTINGTPFEMWHDTSENLDVGKATGIVVGDGPLEVTIDFDLQSFLDQAVNAAEGGTLIDLTTAVDGNADLLIEINPISDDGAGNQDLADALKDNIKLVADML